MSVDFSIFALLCCFEVGLFLLHAPALCYNTVNNTNLLAVLTAMKLLPVAVRNTVCVFSLLELASGFVQHLGFRASALREPTAADGAMRKATTTMASNQGPAPWALIFDCDGVILEVTNPTMSSSVAATWTILFILIGSCGSTAAAWSV